jgi:hypothetical protein
MSVHQCPRCELRFRNETELNYHLTSEHQVDPQSVEPFRYGGAKEQRPLYSDFVEDTRVRPRRVLVVGNAVLRAQRLQEALTKRSDDVEYHLVVPAVRSTPVAGEHSWFETVGEVAHPAEGDLPGRTLATRRLREALGRLRDIGLTIDGSVGDADPLRATSDALKRFKADEILLATLPRAESGWLNADLHSKMERRFSLPVTVVAAA